MHRMRALNLIAGIVAALAAVGCTTELLPKAEFASEVAKDVAAEPDGLDDGGQHDIAADVPVADVGVDSGVVDTGTKDVGPVDGGSDDIAADVPVDVKPPADVPDTADSGHEDVAPDVVSDTMKDTADDVADGDAGAADATGDADDDANGDTGRCRRRRRGRDRAHRRRPQAGVHQGR